MIPLDFPAFNFNIRAKERTHEIFDVIRKKYVVLTDEEWVRQHCIAYLIAEKHCPASLIAVEKALLVNGLKKRTDIVVFAKDGSPKLIVECKAPHIEITNDVFDQIARYNMTLKVDYLFVTNGLRHFCCKIDHVKAAYNFLEEVPDYNIIIK
ncbi:MAG: type I restriction enzyme HsdR N-terminal domain-containing protein [Bacteroidetes bacterium]|nr:type I restriction enzyme HsdR N-terminal domain-containing protein [Bacteroidota bacterium]